MKEKDLLSVVKQFLSYLEAANILTFTRISTNAILRRRGTQIAFQPNPMKGFADIEIVHRGQIGYMELKSEHGKLSIEQQAFRDKRLFHGAKYQVIKSLEEAKLFLMEEMGIDLERFGLKPHSSNRSSVDSTGSIRIPKEPPPHKDQW